MVMIQIEKENKERVFEILSSNGKFIGLQNNQFNILENAESVLKKLNIEKIKYRIIE